MYEYQLTINLDKQCFLKVIFPLGFGDVCPWMEGSRESLNKMTPLPTEQAAQKKEEHCSSSSPWIFLSQTQPEQRLP